MIRWLVQTVVDHPDLSAGRPPAGLLTPAERDYYATLLSPRRRRDWLLGRWTAKQLVQSHIAATKGFCPALDSFSVAHEGDGAPYIASHHPALRGACDEGRVPLAISISHSNGYALCALCDDTLGTIHLGADIELVEPRPDAFAQDFFTTAEQANLNAAPPAYRDLLMTATWSAKETVLKATHLALRANPRDVECTIHPAFPRHWTRISVQLEPALRVQSETDSPLRVWWRAVDNRLRPGSKFVLTLAAFGMTL